jgi:ABC-type transport system involved in multi-copper enzyme maturation permease subunit
VGPLFYYELVRLARRGRGTLLRCAYALALLAALAFAYLDAFPSYALFDLMFGGPSAPARRLNYVGSQFTYTLLMVQYAAVLVLTPAFVAGTVAGERERGTLDLLLTTPLRDRDIVLGKLGAGLAQVGGVLLAGLPVLAATLVWGGVSPSDLLAASALTGLALLSVGGLCVLFSAMAAGAPQALATSYVAVCGIWAPLSVLGWMTLAAFPGWTAQKVVAFASVLAQGLAALVLTRAAVVRLRAGGRPRDGAKRAAKPAAPPPPGRPLPPVGDRPLLWKEVYADAAAQDAVSTERSFREHWRGILAAVAVAAVPLTFLSRTYVFEGAPFFAGLLLMPLLIAFTFVTGGWCLATALVAAESVVGERERRTLDALLALPVPRSRVLAAKWWGAVLRPREVGYMTAAIGLPAVLCGAVHPLAALLLAASAAAYLAFFASAGLWLSVVAPTTRRAYAAAGVLVLVVFGGGWLWLEPNPARTRRELAALYASRPVAAAAADVGLNPVRAWWFLGFVGAPAAPGEGRLYEVRMPAAAGGTLALAALAGVLWWDARRRFRRYGLY